MPVERLPMRVCFIAFHDFRLFPRAFNEALTLVDNGFAVELLGFDKSGRIPLRENKGEARLFRVRPKVWIDAGPLNIFDFLPAFLALFPESIRRRADVYHCYDFVSLVVGLLNKILRNKKLVYDAYENWPELMGNSPNFKPICGLVRKVTMLVEILLASFADYVLTIDSADNELLERYKMFNGNVEVLLNVPRLDLSDNAETHEEYKRRYENHEVVASVGAIAKHMGLLEAVRSMEIVKERVPNAKLLIAGGSGYSYENKRDKDEILSYIKEHKLASYIEFVGPVPYHKILDYLHVAKACLMLYQPTPWLMKYGKSSSKLFLYMLSSKPIVASDMPISQAVMDEHCGILVDPTNPQEIANAIVYLLKNPLEAMSMGKRGKEAVLTKYNWDIFAQKLLSVYEHVIPSADETPSTRFGLLR